MSKELVDSGIDWLGEIPRDWKLERIGNIFEQRNEKVSDYDYKPLSVTKKGVVKQLETAAKSNDHTNRKKVGVNDFVINSRSDRKMSSGVSPLEGSVSLINIVLHGDEKRITPSFTKYLLKNYGFAEEFYRWGTGIVEDLWSTNFSRMKKILIPIPGTYEQQIIANFLDGKTAKIDSIVESTKLSIEELYKYKQSLITEAVTKGVNRNVKLKDSGIKFINEVPFNWSVVPFKRVATVKSNLVNPKNYKDFLQVSPESIEKNTGKLLECKTVEETGIESNNHRFFKGQIIYSKIRPKLNKVTIAPFDGLCSADMYPIETTINSTFLMYYMLSNVFVEQSTLNNNRVKMPKINKEELGRIYTVIPSAEEQKQIVEYLDEQCNHINKIIGSKEQLILEMENYKKSLIYEYVTGKKEVM
ncbi:restriction endonuclease subunit S [Halobacillus sp. BBL2006]|uniref:restriction endonuclease subunit S n=1 Tax=Halobacillus sp. BBL2006 TaxID=1543706 RepID=UPI00054275E6|nr:restriction endonuclease subunit S [Halobacillus sp. BBL2006]KHE69671.1 hypothetical protein LD39_12605 [Halobacillus sp. BBL2006]